VRIACPLLVAELRRRVIGVNRHLLVERQHSRERVAASVERENAADRSRRNSTSKIEVRMLESSELRTRRRGYLARDRDSWINVYDRRPRNGALVHAAPKRRND